VRSSPVVFPPFSRLIRHTAPSRLSPMKMPRTYSHRLNPWDHRVHMLECGGPYPGTATLIPSLSRSSISQFKNKKIVYASDWKLTTKECLSCDFFPTFFKSPLSLLFHSNPSLLSRIITNKHFFPFFVFLFPLP